MLYVLGYIISLIILYLVIETAVKNGINKSHVGKLLERDYGMQKEEAKPLFNDLDD
ncbi:hypothetical protein HNQ94_001108 [Salirhabdus euzebyi]|uniref:Uncharacterized protein n=1 Tax=Salirhabdus euzebyi TaxID=394506 RepID=A0A841Q2C1_9BACI|nr:hypothetical protein [Salirhabdus euzebyi]MBB6452662.1 hypothetical protein [Salirhabdus euzebyi]